MFVYFEIFALKTKLQMQNKKSTLETTIIWYYNNVDIYNIRFPFYTRKYININYIWWVKEKLKNIEINEDDLFCWTYYFEIFLLE